MRGGICQKNDLGDDLIIFSSITKEGRNEILKKLEDLIIDTI